MTSGRDASRLWERGGELAVIEERIEAACAGGGGLLVVAGPAGIGKSSLLDAAAAATAGQRMRVLRARGGPLEADFSYGIVRQLLEPLRATAGAQRWAELTRGAAGLAAIVLDEPAAAPRGDVAHAAVHGLYWLAANLAGADPVLVCVDDVQWADPASLRWLAYLARRLDGLALLLVVAQRTGEPATDPEVLAELLAADTAPLRPGPLGADSVATLVRDRLGAAATDRFCAACLQVTGGNPFLLRALLGSLDGEGTAADDDAAAALGTFGAEEVAAALDRRLARLPAGCRSLLEAVAVLGAATETGSAAALAGLNLETAATAADALREAQVLGAGERLEFAHPLLRSSVTRRIPPGRWALLHPRAARQLAAAGEPADRVALHLLAAAPAADRWAVDILREAARLAAGRGAPETAARYLRRALREPPTSVDRARVLLDLGLARIATREPDAADLLRDAVTATAGPVEKAAAGLRAGSALAMSSKITAITPTLRPALDAADVLDPPLRRRVACELVAAACFTPSGVPVMHELLAAEEARGPTGTSADAMLAAVRAWERSHAADPAAPALVRQAIEGGLFDEAASLVHTHTTNVLLWSDQLDEVGAICGRMIAAGHRLGSPSVVAHFAWPRGHHAYRQGRLADAEADARFSVVFNRRTDTPDGLACVLALLIDVLVARGVLDDADQVLDEAGLPAATPTSWAAVLLTESIGRLRCAQGRIAEGVSLLQDVEACWAALQMRHPNATGWRADLAVALAQLGEVGEAVRIADEQLELARRCGSVRALGVALRTSGMVAKTDGIEALRAAVEVLDPSPFRLEAARALVELGAALRRANQARAARVPLRRGADLAGRCGAAALATRANEELRAAGARPRRARVLGVEALTAREHQVARLAAAGLTNREIAQQLFVTERTIESHLLAAFGKLGVNRRGALTPKLLDAPSP